MYTVDGEVGRGALVKARATLGPVIHEKAGMNFNDMNAGKPENYTQLHETYDWGRDMAVKMHRAMVKAHSTEKIFDEL